VRIAVDLDGVLYEWDKTARFMLRHYKNYASSGPMGQAATSWNYIEEHVAPADWKWLWTEGVDLGLFRYGHVVTGAQSAIRDMRTAGNTVVVVTQRPSAAVPDTIAWLDLFQKKEAGVLFDGIHILTNGEPKHTVQADVLIDDKASNLEAWVGHGRKGILFDSPLNQGAKPAGTERAYGWHDATRIVREMTWVKV